ncbi:hypothetical protein HZB07_06095 [Candidatus Saganbacteria bacterium]|nr:hypothetical protein [Candidatus Saganbacteria bacterium]
MVRPVQSYTIARLLNRNANANFHLLRLLRPLCSPKASALLQENLNKLPTLFERLHQLLALGQEPFTAAIFSAQFARQQIELTSKPDVATPQFVDQVRAILRNTFHCDLVYHFERGLMIISLKERNNLPAGYQLTVPVLSTNALQNISAPEPTAVSVWRRALNSLSGHKDQMEVELKATIIALLHNGNHLCAALLLWRDLTNFSSAQILTLLKAAATKVAVPAPYLALGRGTEPPLTAVAVTAGYLLRFVPYSVGAKFISDMAENDVGLAAQILGVAGLAEIKSETKSVGSYESAKQRSLTGFLIAAMLLSGQDRLAKRLTNVGLAHPALENIYERTLRELHADFSEKVPTREEYQPETSSFYKNGQTNGVWANLISALGLMSRTAIK